MLITPVSDDVIMRAAEGTYRIEGWGERSEPQQNLNHTGACSPLLRLRFIDRQLEEKGTIRAIG